MDSFDYNNHNAHFPPNDRMVSLRTYQVQGTQLIVSWVSQPVVELRACSTRLSALEYLKLLIDNEIAKEILES